MSRFRRGCSRSWSAFAQQRRVAYLLISHNLAVIERLCQHVAVLYLGKVVESAPTESLIRRPVHPYSQMLQAGGARAGAGATRTTRSETAPTGKSTMEYPTGCSIPSALSAWRSIDAAARRRCFARSRRTTGLRAIASARPRPRGGLREPRNRSARPPAGPMGTHSGDAATHSAIRAAEVGDGPLVVGPTANLRYLLGYQATAVERLTVLLVTPTSAVMILPDFDEDEFRALTRFPGDDRPLARQ